MHRRLSSDCTIRGINNLSLTIGHEFCHCLSCSRSTKLRAREATLANIHATVPRPASEGLAPLEIRVSEKQQQADEIVIGGVLSGSTSGKENCSRRSNLTGDNEVRDSEFILEMLSDEIIPPVRQSPHNTPMEQGMGVISGAEKGGRSTLHDSRELKGRAGCSAWHCCRSWDQQLDFGILCSLSTRVA